MGIMGFSSFTAETLSLPFKCDLQWLPKEVLINHEESFGYRSWNEINDPIRFYPFYYSTK